MSFSVWIRFFNAGRYRIDTGCFGTVGITNTQKFVSLKKAENSVEFSNKTSKFQELGILLTEYCDITIF
jgi:hypothetical protein